MSTKTAGRAACAKAALFADGMLFSSLQPFQQIKADALDVNNSHFKWCKQCGTSSTCR